MENEFVENIGRVFLLLCFFCASIPSFVSAANPAAIINETMNIQISVSMSTLSAGDNQQGTISTTLAQPLIVKATYANGDPASGLLISFAISAEPLRWSNAKLSAGSVTTDAKGQAKTFLTLGNRVGTYSVTASNPNLTNSPLTFTAAANDWKTYNYICESPHEYWNNFTNTWVINQQGAIGMQVHFERYALAPGDTIYVMDKNNNIKATYSGDKSDDWSPMVEGDEIRIKLVTNNSLTAYGFRVDKYRANGGSPLPEDTKPPAMITDLTVSNATYNSIKLTWTAPGDDGNSGRAMFYDIRYSTSPINDSNWVNAAQFRYESVPANAGRNQYTTVSGLAQNTLYYFGIKTYDDRGTASFLSNIAIGKTTSTPPVLNWSRMSNGFARDGVDPDSGQCGASFTFTIEYSDRDNDAPAPGYPKVAIFAGDNLFGNFTMAHVDPLDNNYKNGKLYTYNVTLPRVGVYNYQFAACDINNVPAQGIPTCKQGGPVVSNAPVMKWLGTAYMGYEYDGLEPHKGNSETQFIFKIRYMDVDGDAPDIDSPRLHLFVGGEDITPRKTGYIMKPLTSANNDYKAGVIYSCSVQLKNNGEYSYEFRGEDSNGVSDGGAACTRMMGPTVSGRNVGPTLSWPVGKNTGVVPVMGEPKQVFVFEVVYADINNDAPGKGYPVVKIRRNGERIDTLYPMTLVGTGTYAKGILYRAEISLAPGIYYHSFDANDSYGSVSTGVPRSMQKGPYVAYAPSLSNGEHTPALGQVSQTRFTFKVKYMDACNYTPYPGYPKVHILCGNKEIPESPFSMSSSDSSKPEIGKQYQYTGVLPYVSDVYTYYFEVINYLKVPGTSTMKYQGPKVLLDITPPAQITTLQTSNPQVGSITLTWTAPGDDGTSGTAFAYDIRYATATITEANWNNATQCQNEPSPLAAGIQQSLVVTGLQPYTRYCFVMKTRDEVENWSGVSNVAVGTTTAVITLTTQVTPPNGSVSFTVHPTTTSTNENYIRCIADIKPDFLDATYNSQIIWEIDDDPRDTYQSGDPTNPPKGSAVSSQITIPPVPAATNGRGFPLSYRIRAFVNINNATYTSVATYTTQDERDQIRQEYIDMGKKQTPTRADFVNAQTYVNPGHFPFNEINSSKNPAIEGKYNWAIFTIGQHLENIRGSLTTNKSMPVNSGYRNPIKNDQLSGSADNSYHIYGRAADIGVQDWNNDGKIDRDDRMVMKSRVETEGGKVEDIDKTLTWVHMQW